MLLVAGIADHAYAASKSALCNSGLGQLGQAFDPAAAHDCSLYTGLESLTGWLVAGVVVALLTAAGVLVAHDRQPSAGRS